MNINCSWARLVERWKIKQPRKVFQLKFHCKSPFWPEKAELFNNSEKIPRFNKFTQKSRKHSQRLFRLDEFLLTSQSRILYLLQKKLQQRGKEN